MFNVTLHSDIKCQTRVGYQIPPNLNDYLEN